MKYALKESEQFRAGIFKFLATPFFIPFGLVFMEFWDSNFKLSWIMFIKFGISIVAIVVGLVVYCFSYSIMKKVDREEVEYHG